jgi:hypothetical protein
LIANTLTAEVSSNFIVSKDHSVKVVRLPSFVERAAACTPARKGGGLTPSKSPQPFSPMRT